MNFLDWIILLVTISSIAIYGSWKNRKNSNLSEYFKANSSSKWWTVGISVMATQASAITFLSTPGQAFHDGMGFVQFYFGLPFAVIIICLFFLPLYHKLKVYTAYEFLEHRFDYKTRTLTAILFLLQRGLAAGITIYAPAIILSVVLKWDLELLIIIIGIIVTIYTVIGGTRAVNVTQKQQMFIIFIGMFFSFNYILNSFPEKIDFNTALNIAGFSNKLNILDFSFDLNNRYTFWSGITGGLFLALSYFGTDQSQVQRYLSGKSLRESQKGLIMNGFLKVPMQFFILLVGVMVFVFYQFNISPLNFNPNAIEKVKKSYLKEDFIKLEKNNIAIQLEKHKILKEKIDDSSIKKIKTFQEIEKKQRLEAKKIISKIDPNQELNDKDYVFISFILNNLPKGLIGLLIAVILSAAMSSTASELNALAATTMFDLYKRNFNYDNPKRDLLFSKLFTIIWGLIAITLALFTSLAENLIQLVNIIGSVFYGTILGIFLLAFFSSKIKGKIVFWSAILSEVLIILIFIQNIIGYLWLNVLGAFFTVIFSIIGHRIKLK
ncbi:MAG: sodium:solute symporter [Flavobacteriaceae bacterium]|nr:sodium:solute symporter [Flavobacteriaceae bacterium]